MSVRVVRMADSMVRTCWRSWFVDVEWLALVAVVDFWRGLDLTDLVLLGVVECVTAFDLTA
jgi:hypothetical protein